MKTIIPHPENFEKIKAAIKNAGYQNLHILSDFDRTLTYGYSGGTKIPSIVSVLRDGNHLTKEYAQKAQALFEKYYPIEKDLKIPFLKRKAAMREWWITHNKLLIESGLNWSDLEDIVQNSPIKFREGVLEFLDFLFKHEIPLVILSASGCGDAIKLFFEKAGKDYPNIFYVANRFSWGKNGRAISTQQPVIHVLNKDETILAEIPSVYRSIKDRENVILLGDGVGDLGMIEGFKYNHLLKIGFLNSDFDKAREEYLKNFDVVLEGDGDFGFVNELIGELG